MAVENLFAAVNTRSALKLGHVRGVAMLAAVEADVQVAEYTPAEVKRAVVGYGRAEKHQVQQMVKLLLGLTTTPAPHDVADALAVAICPSTVWPGRHCEWSSIHHEFFMASPEVVRRRKLNRALRKHRRAPKAREQVAGVGPPRMLTRDWAWRTSPSGTAARYSAWGGAPRELKNDCLPSRPSPWTSRSIDMVDCRMCRIRGPRSTVDVL